MNMKRTLCLILAGYALAVSLAAQTPPRAIRIECGDIRIELASRFFWNLNGIWYKGENICLQNRGFYGTVAYFDPLGWVGTGHLENKIGETELNVAFSVDGEPWQPSNTPVKCTRFEMKKTSLLHQLRLEYILKLENNRLTEYAAVTVENDCRIRNFYHFMHPWAPLFTEYLAGDREGKATSGAFSAAERETIVSKKPDWAAFYAPKEQFGMISAVRDKSAPPVTNDGWLFWNRLDDRKLYYVLPGNVTLNKGQRFESGMITGFFSATPENWRKRASEETVLLKDQWKNEQ